MAVSQLWRKSTWNSFVGVAIFTAACLASAPGKDCHSDNVRSNVASCEVQVCVNGTWNTVCASHNISSDTPTEDVGVNCSQLLLPQGGMLECGLWTSNTTSTDVDLQCNTNTAIINCSTSDWHTICHTTVQLNGTEAMNSSGVDGPRKTLCSSMVCCTQRYTPSSEYSHIQTTPSPSPMTSHENTYVRIRPSSSPHMDLSTLPILPYPSVTKPVLTSSPHYSWDRLILIVSVTVAVTLLIASVIIAATCICGCFVVRKRRRERQRIAALQKELREWGSCTQIQNLHRGSTLTFRQENLGASTSNLNSEACVSTSVTSPPSSNWRGDAITPTSAVPNSYEDRTQVLQYMCGDSYSPYARPRMGSSTFKFLKQLSGHMVFHAEDIVLLECIGQGEFGIVYKASLTYQGRAQDAKSSELVAIKTLKGYFDKTRVQYLMEESLKMKRFSHPHVLGLIGVCVDAGPAPYIITPYMEHGSLLSYLRVERSVLVVKDDADAEEIAESAKRMIDMCLQIAKGMEYLAEERFVHRDLAARNCMIDTTNLIKVADFGLTEDMYAKNYYRQDVDAEIKLPVKWMALESFTDGIFSEKTDVWSFGVTCWEVFSGGRMPYPTISPFTMVTLLESEYRLDRPKNAAVSNEIYSLMLQCWDTEPQNRPVFSEIVQNLSSFLEQISGYVDMGNFSGVKLSVPVGGVASAAMRTLHLDYTAEDDVIQVSAPAVMDTHHLDYTTEDDVIQYVDTSNGNLCTDKI